MTVKEANEYYKQNAKCIEEIFSGLRKRTECFSNPCKDCLWDLTKEREAKEMAIRSLSAWEKVIEEIKDNISFYVPKNSEEMVMPYINPHGVIHIIKKHLGEVER